MRLFASGSDPLIHKLFRQTLFVMIIAELATSVATMFDGIIIARFFDRYAVASYGLTTPYTNLIKTVGCFFATGTQVVYSRYAASGDIRKANSAFTVSAAVLTVGSLLAAAAIFLFSQEIAGMLGASRDPAHLQAYTSQYLKGLAFGFPMNLGTVFLIPFMNIDGDKKRISLSINVMLISNLAGDLLVAKVFHAGVFGLALVTSISYMLSFAVLLLHFRKDSFIRLQKIGSMKEVARAGVIPAVMRSFSMIRSYAVNLIFLSLAGTGFLAANTLVQGNIKAVPMCIAAAIGTTTLSISGVLYGEHDRRGLKQIFRSALVISFGQCLVIALVVFVFARQIVGIFGSPDIAEDAVLALRCWVVGLPFIGAKMFFVYYFQATEKRRLSYYSSFAGEFLFLVLTLQIAGKLFGDFGMFASYPVAEILYLVSIVLIAWAKCGHFPRRLEDLLFLDKDFDADESKIIDVSIHGPEEVPALSEHAMDFCRANGVDDRRSLYLSLVVEEMAGNIFEHGADDGKPHFVDMKIIVLGDSVKLRLRDNCRQFNPKERAEMMSDDPEHNIGLRIVSQISKDMSYVGLFNLNQLTIEI